ncbi:hypothetical protein BCR44DRAFT_1132846 [Catenaria anguillulae PL171]|uniref:Uncharacterized protein n=1 Tax=Catenaria anguillulae PL171 TaxID=765915 RepID=A0A1Y2HN31_9FUNG|nr:hypothetical protein BCR44DRAFT_1132846 [Catenaria anguillulae PL171]
MFSLLNHPPSPHTLLQCATHLIFFSHRRFLVLLFGFHGSLPLAFFVVVFSINWYCYCLPLHPGFVVFKYMLPTMPSLSCQRKPHPERACL